MVLELSQEDKVGTGRDASVGKEAELELDNLLAGLSSNMLAERIIDAARVAAARHMLVQAQAMRSSVEAENSTNMGK